eukprot:COSAG04_NODE_7675_length_1089_cov_0.773737_1_plen_324_part_10
MQLLKPGEEEHTLHNEVRQVLHKSKLNVATSWATAIADSEDFRRMEHVFQKVEEFRKITNIKVSKQWQQHFPAAKRPAIYAWIASAPQDETDLLQWFMEELAYAEEEQQRVLPKWLRIERLLCKQIASLEGDGRPGSVRASSTQSLAIPMNRQSVNLLQKSRTLAESDSDDSSGDEDWQRVTGRMSRGTISTAQDNPEEDAVATLTCGIRVQAFLRILKDNISETTFRQTAVVFAAIVVYSMTLYCSVNFAESRTSDCEAWELQQGDSNITANATASQGDANPESFERVYLLTIWAMYVALFMAIMNAVQAVQWKRKLVCPAGK